MASTVSIGCVHAHPTRAPSVYGSASHPRLAHPWPPQAKKLIKWLSSEELTAPALAAAEAAAVAAVDEAPAWPEDAPERVQAAREAKSKRLLKKERKATKATLSFGSSIVRQHYVDGEGDAPLPERLRGVFEERRRPCACGGIRRYHNSSTTSAPSWPAIA